MNKMINYTLVDNKKCDNILHFNAVHSMKNINRGTITAIPVFRSKREAEQFRNDIIRKKQIREWYITMDNKTSNSICQAKELSNNTYNEIYENVNLNL